MSMVGAGKLVSEMFQETKGTREGAVESPHLFNAYIDSLRLRLESQHPHLYQLLFMTIAVLLYADDAALPADSADDLETSARIAEDFFNEHHLFISASKTY
eukprot:2690397-Karenia_brevis.AAC.1